MRDLHSESPQVKYCAAKNAIAISETNPRRLYSQFPFFLELLDGENQVAKSKPELLDEVVAQVLKVEHYRYESEECRNVVIGKAITALGEFGEQIQDNKKVRNFLERQTHISRNATKTKAVKLLRRQHRAANRAK